MSTAIPGDKVQCVDASPHGQTGETLLRKGGVYVVVATAECSCPEKHVQYGLRGMYPYMWASHRFEELKPPENELTENIRRYIRDPHRQLEDA